MSALSLITGSVPGLGIGTPALMMPVEEVPPRLRQCGAGWADLTGLLAGDDVAHLVHDLRAAPPALPPVVVDKLKVDWGPSF